MKYKPLQSQELAAKLAETVHYTRCVCHTFCAGVKVKLEVCGLLDQCLKVLGSGGSFSRSRLPRQQAFSPRTRL